MNHDKLFNLFTDPAHYADYAHAPFSQGGYSVATDGVALISLPCTDLPPRYKPREAPDTSKFLTFVRCEPITISIAALEQAIINNTPLVDEYKTDGGKCGHCDGEGFQECDLGHEHDCEPCNATGEIKSNEKTGNKIPDDRAIFLVWGKHIARKQLLRLIEAAKEIDAETISLISKDDYKPVYFSVGEFTIAIMSCHIDESHIKLEL